MIKIERFSYIYLLVIIFTSISTISKSQNSEIENSVLWKISGNGIQSPSYLFGTIHIIPEKEYLFSQTAQNCFDSCKTLVLETDIDLPLKKQIELAKQIVFPDGKSVEDYLSAQQYQHFNSYFLDSLKISKSTYRKIQKIKPIFASALVLSEFLDKPVSYEQNLSKSAKRKKMSSEFLETIDFQMSTVEKVSIEEQIKMMYIDGLTGNPTTEYNELLTAYKEQNLTKMSRLFAEEEDIENFEQDFLITRNKNWIPIIENFAKKNSCFIAVGAGHLAGENGLIRLLRNEGFTLTPLK